MTETNNDYGYANFLEKNSLSDEDLWFLMRYVRDPIPNASVDSVFMLAPSPIHGKGMFALRDVRRGEIFPATTGEIRFNLSRYVNHKDTPNAFVRMVDGDAWCEMLCDIEEGDEITMDYNDNKVKFDEDCSA